MKAVYERGETYVHWETIRDRTGVKVDPASVKIRIQDPCGKTLLSWAAMTKNATGEYYYNYLLNSAATYGLYVSTVSATSSGAAISQNKKYFHILPWNAVEEVRHQMGLAGDDKSVTDDAVAYLVWNSYKDALNDVHIHHYMELPGGNPYTGAMWDGTNTSFTTKACPIADYDGDGTVRGWGVSCATDVFASWVNILGVRNTASAAVTNAASGEITIKQANGSTPIPLTAQAVYLDYWEEPVNYDDTLFRQAVVYLACHMLSKRLVSTDKVTVADLQKNNPVIVLNPSMWRQEYDRLLRRLRGPSVGGVTG